MYFQIFFSIQLFHISLYVKMILYLLCFMVSLEISSVSPPTLFFVQIVYYRSFAILNKF